MFFISHISVLPIIFCFKSGRLGSVGAIKRSFMTPSLGSRLSMLLFGKAFPARCRKAVFQERSRENASVLAAQVKSNFEALLKTIPVSS
jgi:hypothetical protein